MDLIPRRAESKIREFLEIFPVVAIIGPRQSGKSTLAKEILKNYKWPNIFLDLELPSDLKKLEEAEIFFEQNSQSIVCLDEIQQKPDLFPTLRAHIDKKRENGKFLILGSASPELLKQGSESLAGRIAFVEQDSSSSDLPRFA